MTMLARIRLPSPLEVPGAGELTAYMHDNRSERPLSMLPGTPGGDWSPSGGFSPLPQSLTLDPYLTLTLPLLWNSVRQTCHTFLPSSPSLPPSTFDWRALRSGG